MYDLPMHVLNHTCRTKSYNLASYYLYDLVRREVVYDCSYTVPNMKQPNHEPRGGYTILSPIER